MEASEDNSGVEREPDAVAGLIDGGAQLIDVRQEHEFETGRIPGAVRIGLETLAENRDLVDDDRPVVFYCRTGSRAEMAAQAFSAAGFEATALAGGITAWIEDGRAIDPEDGYVSEPGEAASILEARARAATN